MEFQIISDRLFAAFDVFLSGSLRFKTLLHRKEYKGFRKARQESSFLSLFRQLLRRTTP